MKQSSRLLLSDDRMLARVPGALGQGGGGRPDHQLALGPADPSHGQLRGGRQADSGLGQTLRRGTGEAKSDVERLTTKTWDI